MSNTDVLPTLFSMLDLPVPDDIQGVDIFSDAAQNNRPLVCCYGHKPERKNLSIFDERYRYTYFPLSGEEELYDHRNDPGELDNLAYEPAEKHKSIILERRRELLERHAKNETGVYNLYSLW